MTQVPRSAARRGAMLAAQVPRSTMVRLMAMEGRMGASAERSAAPPTSGTGGVPREPAAFALHARVPQPTGEMSDLPALAGFYDETARDARPGAPSAALSPRRAAPRLALDLQLGEETDPPPDASRARRAEPSPPSAVCVGESGQFKQRWLQILPSGSLCGQPLHRLPAARRARGEFLSTRRPGVCCLYRYWTCRSQQCSRSRAGRIVADCDDARAKEPWCFSRTRCSSACSRGKSWVVRARARSATEGGRRDLRNARSGTSRASCARASAPKARPPCLRAAVEGGRSSARS